MVDLGAAAFGAGGGWSAQNALWHGGVTGGHAVGLSFDPEEERLWVSDSTGYLSSYTLHDQSLYSSTRACWITNYDDPSWAITNLQGHGFRPSSAAR